MTKGFIHSFQSMGTLDGPGVRFLIFMQGCPLRCGYCHNPDTWQIQDYKFCETPQQVLSRILKYKNYFGEDGGITVSGGEALLQPKFVTELFALCKEQNIPTCLDTSGCIMNKEIQDLLTVTDLVLLDVKMTEKEQYLIHTKANMDIVMEFLDYLELNNIPTWVRYVVVPGFNDTPEQIVSLKKLLKGYVCIKKVEFLPFRKLCTEKYEKLNINFPFARYAEEDEVGMKKIELLFDRVVI